MTLIQLQTLVEVIDEGLDALKGGSNREIAEWVESHYPEVLDEHTGDLRLEALQHHIRDRRKQRSPAEEIKRSGNLCLDFGVPNMLLDSEISIPKDLNDPIYSGSIWKEADDATLEDIDAHILLLEAQARANVAKAKNWRTIRHAAARFANGNTKLTLGELRQIARGDADTRL